MTGEGLLTDLLVLAEKNSDDVEYRAMGLIWLDLIIKDIQNRQQSFHWRFLETTTTFNTAADDFDYVISTIASDMENNCGLSMWDRWN